MRQSDSLEQAREYGQEAVRLMDQHGIAPHPENFAVWYDYVSGRRHDLVRALDVLISNKIELTEDRNHEIYVKFYGRKEEAFELGDTCDRLVELMSQVSEQAGIGAADQSAYCERLIDITEDIGAAKDGQALPKLVASLLTETKTMMEKSRSMAEELGKTSAQVDDLRRHLDEAREEALTDSLTGIGNRKQFDLCFRKEAAAATENGEPLSLIMCDIDHFKVFNDTFGHRIGDEVLKVTARVIKDSVKGRDISARYGGEEFCVVLPNTNLEQAVVVADQIRKTLAGRALTNRKSGESYGTITLSLGVGQLRLGEPLDELVKRADEALYRAKRDGRNRVETEASEDAPFSLTA